MRRKGDRGAWCLARNKVEKQRMEALLSSSTLTPQSVSFSLPFILFSCTSLSCLSSYPSSFILFFFLSVIAPLSLFLSSSLPSPCLLSCISLLFSRPLLFLTHLHCRCLPLSLASLHVFLATVPFPQLA